MTEKLFYEDSHRTEFTAKVISCEEAKDGYRVVLDQTVFFPEGGGQYADTGVLGTVNVTDVHEKDDVIYHYTTAPLEVGSIVTGKINWEERFEKMQQHTGEHIVSGIVHERFGYNNVGFHLGADYCTMDFDGTISKEQLKEIEAAANEAVYQDLEIEILYPSKDELKDMDYRSKIEIEGQVRIVKLVSMANYKGGERITMLCGRRAMRDYEKKDAMTKEISALLCAKEYEVADAVGKLKDEQTRMKSQIAELQQKLLEFRVAEIPVEEKIVTVFDSALSGNLPREMMKCCIRRTGRRKAGDGSGICEGNR